MTWPIFPSKNLFVPFAAPLFFGCQVVKVCHRKKTLVWKYKGFVLGKNGLNLSHHQLVYKGNLDFFPLFPFAKFGKCSHGNRYLIYFLTLKKKMKLGSGSLPHMNRFEPNLQFLKF
jgi:hypothetical protein